MAKVSSHDAYIKASATFAQPILTHLRELVHKACPDVTETIKWGFPHFEYKGMLCHMAGFKNHCTFGFWKASLMEDKENILRMVEKHSMGHLDKITSLSDLPSDKILLAYIRQAAKLNEDDVKLMPRQIAPDKKLSVPTYFLKAVKSNPAAFKTFESFSYTNKKEYVEWVEDAKSDATRQNRLETAVDWMAEGKIRNWKYVKK
jgi:uncharacterized protein YdeI (YjbR/CyaY-like superfamily)